MKIFLSVGHSILKSGACTSASGVVNEYAYNKIMGNYCAEYLRNVGNTVDFIVCPEREFNKVGDERSYKLGIIRNGNYDLVIELHLNSFNGNAKGCEVFYYAGDAEGKKYSEDVCRKLGGIFANRGAKTSKSIGGLYMVDETKPTAVLIESFFCDNSDDCKKGNDMKTVARLIAEGIAVKGIYEGASGVNSGSNSLYRVQVGAFNVIENAEKLCDELKKKGYDAFIK